MSESFVLSLKHDLSLQVFLPIVGMSAQLEETLNNRTLNHCSLLFQLMIFEAHATEVTQKHSFTLKQMTLFFLIKQIFSFPRSRAELYFHLKKLNSLYRVLSMWIISVVLFSFFPFLSVLWGQWRQACQSSLNTLRTIPYICNTVILSYYCL